MAKPTKTNPYGIEVGQTLYYDSNGRVQTCIVEKVGRKYFQTSISSYDNFFISNLQEDTYRARKFLFVSEQALNDDKKAKVLASKLDGELRYNYGFFQRLPLQTLEQMYEILKPHIEK